MTKYTVTATAQIVKEVEANDERHAKNIVNLWLRDRVKIPNPKELFIYTVAPAADKNKEV